MATEGNKYLLELIIGTLVVIAVVIAIFYFINGGTLEIIKGFGGGSSDAEKTDFSKVTEPRETIASFNYPIFEYKDRRLIRNLFYTYTDEWKISENKKDWLDAGNYFPELKDKDYSDGLKVLIDKTISGSRRWLLKTMLVTDYVKMGSDKEFSVSYKKAQADPSKTFIFKFENGEWLWKLPSAGLDWSDKIVVAGFYGEPTEFIEKLFTIDEFYTGCEVIFTEGNTLRENE